MVGTGRYAENEYDLGIQEDVIIPLSIDPVQAEVSLPGKGQAQVSVRYKGNNDLRIIFSETNQDGRPLRISGGAPPDGTFMSKILNIKAYQGNNEIPVMINYDKQIWSGLSWAAGEIANKNLKKYAGRHSLYCK